MSTIIGSGVPVIIGPITGVATIPAYTTEAGTYTVDSTTKTVLISDGGATPTCNFANIAIGDYLMSGGEIRKVVANYTVGNNQRVDIKTAFSVDPSGQAVYHIKNKVYKMVEIQNIGSGLAKVNGQNFFNSITPLRFESDNGLEAIVVDGTTSHLQVVAQI